MQIARETKGRNMPQHVSFINLEIHSRSYFALCSCHSRHSESSQILAQPVVTALLTLALGGHPEHKWHWHVAFFSCPVPAICKQFNLFFSKAILSFSTLYVGKQGASKDGRESCSKDTAHWSLSI